jgi:hypothetical protein
MLDTILAFVRLLLATLTPVGDGTGGPSPHGLPVAAEERAAAAAAVEASGRPEAMPPGQDANDGLFVDDSEAQGPPADAPPVADPPVDAPPVDVSEAPGVDLAAAVDTAGPPEDVELPDQAGGEAAGPPEGVPPAEATDVVGCATGAQGRDAADCSGRPD